MDGDKDTKSGDMKSDSMNKPDIIGVATGPNTSRSWRTAKVFTSFGLGDGSLRASGPTITPLFMPPLPSSVSRALSALGSGVHLPSTTNL